MKKFLKSGWRQSLIIGSAVCFLLTGGAVFHLFPATGSGQAYAASGNESSGGGGGQGGGNDQHAGGGGHGPNPNCPYQDRSGRGGYAGSGHGKGGHSGEDTGSDAGTTSVDTTTSGGSPGGENFVCDQPGSWHANNKIYLNH